MADVVVTERCDQTLVEVYTCPPSGGGGGSGAFYTGVNLGTGAAVYIETDDDADPREHRFRTLVGVDGTTVAAVGDEIHISGGGSYTGVNVGGGAEVYKETDDTTSPREHRYRTIIGNNILVAQDDSTVILSAMASAAGGGPPGVALGKLSGGCGATSTIQPSALAGLAVGDLILWVVISGRTNTLQVPFCLDPAGWSVLARRSNIANEYHQSHFYYKRADGLDVAGATHSVSINAGAGVAALCSTAFVYKNAHLNLPFGGCARIPFGRYSPAYPPHTPTFSSAQQVMQMWQFRGVGNPAGATWPFTQRVGPPVDLENFHALFDSFNQVWMNWQIATRMASVFEDENWIPGESLTSSLGGAGWSGFNMIASVQSGPWALIRGAAVNSRHYWEYQVTLEAGIQYQFSYINQGTWVASQPNDWTTISYVDPAGNERGFQSSQGQAGDAPLDPLGDLNTVWFNRSLNAGRSGVPSTTGSLCRICFTAQTSGIYKLRIGIGAGTGTPVWVYTGNGAENRNVTSVAFRKGWENYRRVNTAAGPVYGGAVRGLSYGQGWQDGIGSGTGQIYTSVAINPDWTQLPKTKMTSASWVEGDLNGVVEDDEFTNLNNAFYPSDDEIQLMVATRPIMPRINGALQKYYFEFTVVSGSINEHSLGAVSLPACRGGYSNDQVGYVWDCSTGACWDIAGSTFALNAGVSNAQPTGTVVGVAVDYANSEVKFYKNNVLACTVPMSNTYPATNFSPEWPLWAWVRPHSEDSIVKIRANLAGPFAFPQTGFLPYDWAGAVETTTVDEIVSVGGGISLVGGTDSAPTIKSLVAGTNVTVTDNGDTIGIAAFPTTVRGAAWSDSTAIDILKAKPVSVVCPRAGTIISSLVMADTVGSAAVSVYVSSYTDYPSLALICGVNKPKLVTVQKSRDAALAGWQTAVNAGDILTFVLDSCSGLKTLSVQLELKEVT